MTGTMNTGGSQPMGMASAGAGDSMSRDMGARGAESMGTMDGGGAKPADAMGDMSGSKPMGMAATGGVQGNGGGPEPHQGSNPGAQSDPGPKEIGFYDKADGHMGGDDGVQNAVERPSPMRMDGVDGTQPNAGQRGGQNTGTSGSQTTSQVGWRMAGTARSRAGAQQSQDSETKAAQVTSPSSGEKYGTGGVSDAMGNHEPGHVGAGGTHEPGHASATGNDESGRSDAMGTHKPGHTGMDAAEGAYQSRAAQRLATAESGTRAVGGRMDEPVEDFDSTPAARASEMAEGAVEKAQGFFARAKDTVEDFLNADVDGDGSVGSQDAQTSGAMSFAKARGRSDSETYGTGGTAKVTSEVSATDDWGQTNDWDQADDGWDSSSAGTSYERDTPGTRPYNAGVAARTEAKQREKELTAA